MSIKPIDLQTNIAHSIDVAKNEHNRAEGLIEKQHLLDQEADTKSNAVKSKLNENKKAEHTTIRMEERRQPRKQHNAPGKERKKETPQAEQVEVVKDVRLGNFIDVKK